MLLLLFQRLPAHCLRAIELKMKNYGFARGNSEPVVKCFYSELDVFLNATVFPLCKEIIIIIINITIIIIIIIIYYNKTIIGYTKQVQRTEDFRA